MLFDLYTYFRDTISNSERLLIDDKRFPICIRYNYPFKEMLNEIKQSSMQYICNSNDINEDIIYGEYDYFYTEINGLNILYHRPTHFGIWPSRIILYDGDYSFTITNETDSALIFRITNNMKQLFEIKNNETRQKEMIYMLWNTDRPKLN